MKIGFLFPGQGAQTIGMGKDLYDNFEEVRNVYENAKKITGVDVANITFDGTEENLCQTKNTQLAIVVMSMSILEILEKNNIKAEYATGLSLGEYVALYYGGAMDMNTVFYIIKKRGEFMQNLVPEGDWSMAAVLGLEDEKVEELCKKVTKGFVVPANYNCPGQVAVSGEKAGIEELIVLGKEAGAKRVLELKTSGPFHTEKLINSSNALKEELKNIEVNMPNKCKVIKNLDAKPYVETDNIKEILEKHIVNPVRFSDSIKYMIENGVDTFIEIGPGKVLSGFVKKINKEATILNICDMDSLNNVLEKLSL